MGRPFSTTPITWVTAMRQHTAAMRVTPAKVCDRVNNTEAVTRSTASPAKALMMRALRGRVMPSEESM